ncbi:MAG TPA: NAD(P)H-hydrate epimerase [Pirellulales bacterium]|nr:NAD(P)H-hydrate epimerase [Pirellulales bacterium]
MTSVTLSRQRAGQLDRRATAEFAVPGIVLMENAGRGVAEQLLQLGVRGTVVICCGPGNNGGDGFVIARHLDLRRIAVKVMTWGSDERRPADAATNFQVLLKSGIRLVRGDGTTDLTQELAGADWIVDALLGTGARGEVRPPLAEVIVAINSSGVPVMAVDLPSGLDADNGLPARQTICARHTCTFVAYKLGFLAPGADRFTGQIHVVDIGAPRTLVDEMLAAGG